MIENWSEPPGAVTPPSQEWRIEVNETVEAIDRLPDGMRATLIGGALGETYDDMAERFGWHGGTLRSRLSRGRAELRRRMNG